MEGAVQALHFTPNGTFADFLPSAVSKGDGTELVGSTVSVELGFQLEPEDNFTQAWLTYNPGAPVLLPGDRALLLVSKDPATGQLSAQTGYQAFAETATGTIEAPAKDGAALFSNQINGQTLPALTR